MMLPEARRQYVLEVLRKRGSVRSRQLARELGVSYMTIYRDLKVLEAQGRVHLVRGGAVRAQEQTAERCALCHKPIDPCLQSRLQKAEGMVKYCCPHCAVEAWKLVPTALLIVQDFLTGRAIRGDEAIYVVTDRVARCCEPGVYAFASLEQARRFAQAFRGQVYVGKTILQRSVHLAGQNLSLSTEVQP